MVWLSGAIEFNAPIANQHDFTGNIVLHKEDTLLLHGSVIGNETGKPTPGVLVELHARVNDGTEYLLGQAFSNDQGEYLLHVDKKRINEDITAIILRAATSYRLQSLG